MKIIGISGKSGSGKTTLGGLLSILLPRSAIFHIADTLKWKAKEDFDLSDYQLFGRGKDEVSAYLKCTPRDVLIRMGNFYRSIDPHFWIRRCVSRAQGSGLSFVLVPDVRFQNEAKRISQNGGFMIRLERRYELLNHGPHETDISETDLDNAVFDWTVPADENENLDTLERHSHKLVKYITLGNGVI